MREALGKNFRKDGVPLGVGMVIEFAHPEFGGIFLGESPNGRQGVESVFVCELADGFVVPPIGMEKIHGLELRLYEKYRADAVLSSECSELFNLLADH